MTRRVSELASDLADASVLDVAGSCGPGVGIDYELRELRAAQVVAETALAAAFARYRSAALSRAGVRGAGSGGST